MEKLMLKKLASLSVVAALICTLGGVRAFAQSLSSLEGKSARLSEAPVTGDGLKTEAQPKQGLKADIAKLVADARAGKGLTIVDPQSQPAQSNSLSKTTKIALAVGIGLAIVLVIIVIHAKNHLFDDFTVR
jgi:hypothetical protein